MKKLFLASIVFGVLVAPAMAADQRVKAPILKAPPAPVFSWSGCYIGAHGGYGWGRNKNDFGAAIASCLTEGFEGFPAEFGPFDHDTSGGVVGGQVGCNLQSSNNLVAGFEGEGWWSGMKGSFTAPEDGSDPGAFSRFESSNRWDAGVAVRLGYAWDRSLLYGKAGVVFGSFSYTETHDDFPTTHACFAAPGGVCSVSLTDTQAGLLLGAGWEYAFTNTWSFKVEYDYINFSSHSIPYPSAGAGLPRFSVSDTKQIVKVGLNYRFGGG